MFHLSPFVQESIRKRHLWVRPYFPCSSQRDLLVLDDLEDGT